MQQKISIENAVVFTSQTDIFNYIRNLIMGTTSLVDATNENEFNFKNFIRIPLASVNQ